MPDSAASSVFESLTSSGIRGVLNFAPVRLRAADDIIVGTVNLVSELENVIYFVNVAGKARSRK